MIVICYTDPSDTNRTQLWSRTTSLQNFKDTHPEYTIHMAFREDTDIFNRVNEYEEAFISAHQNYGFDITDLHKKFRGHDGNVYELYGLKPKNRKYKCMVRDVNTETYYKMTPMYVKTQLDRNPIT